MECTPGKPLRVYDSSNKWKDYSTDEFISQNLNYLAGWHCGMGVENLFINSDGEVFGASCYMGGSFGNVFDYFVEPSKWAICDKEKCSCGADLFIPKVSSPEYKINLAFNRSTSSPMDSLKDIVAMEKFDSNEYKQVHWEIGRRCNYNCSYCWSDIHNNFESHKSFEELVSATMIIQEKFIKDSKCNFVITGGEPTANAAFLDWCRYLKGFDYRLSMHSNGSRSADYYEELVQYGDLNLSVHFEFWNQDKFLKVVERVVEAKVKKNNIDIGHLEIKLMMQPENREKVIEVENLLKSIPEFSNYCTWSIVPIKDNKKFHVGTKILLDGFLLSGYNKNDYKLFGSRK